MRMRIIDPVRPRVTALEDPGACWLHCDLCSRFFQYRTALPSHAHERDACPFPDCTGIGLGFNLFIWDDMREPDDPRWPKSTEELRHGLRSPEMDSFYRDQRQAAIDRMMEAFEASAERKTLAHAPRYVAAFLDMQAALEWDLASGEPPCTEPEPGELGLVAEWLRIRNRSEGALLLAELRAFFAFAHRTQAAPDLEPWIALLESPEEAEVLNVSTVC